MHVTCGKMEKKNTNKLRKKQWCSSSTRKSNQPINTTKQRMNTGIQVSQKKAKQITMTDSVIVLLSHLLLSLL